MSDCVPDFHEMQDAYEIPNSSRFSKPKKPAPGEEDVMELMWQNGQVVVQKSSKKNSFPSSCSPEIRIYTEEQQEQQQQQQQHQNQHLFMQEDEMASWLQYPLDDSFDRDLYTDLLYSAPITTATSQPVPRPEISPRAQNFGHFSRLPGRQRFEPVQKPSAPTVRETTVVESNVTPVTRPDSRFSLTVSESMPPVNTETGTSGAAIGEISRKRKANEADDNESQSEEIEYEAAQPKKPIPGSSSTKRSHAAEVHNQSERRRRDRINEKMKALQELIPRCNKSDKASMLDEAIEYLKSLQMQVQMMSMGYGVMPMMYPGMQQYMPTMGMGMGMGMNRPVVQYPPMMPGSTIPNAAAAQVGPRFPMPGFHMPPVGLPNSSRIQAQAQAEPMLNPLFAHNPNHQRMPNFIDPYQQFLGLHQGQMPLPQSQGVVQPSVNNPSTSKNAGNAEHQQTG